MKEKLKNVLTLVLAILVGFVIGYDVERNHPRRVSTAALNEIIVACNANHRDVLVNRRYVYANCQVDGEHIRPVTVQNYEMK